MSPIPLLNHWNASCREGGVEGAIRSKQGEGERGRGRGEKEGERGRGGKGREREKRERREKEKRGTEGRRKMGWREERGDTYIMVIS